MEAVWGDNSKKPAERQTNLGRGSKSGFGFGCLRPRPTGPLIPGWSSTERCGLLR
jgi:hypothetical protein